MEPCDTADCISLGLPTEILNFLFERNGRIGLIEIYEKCNYDNIHQARVPSGFKVFFDTQENRGRRHNVVDVQGNVVHEHHTLKCCALTCTKTERTCI